MEKFENIWGIYHININCTDLQKSRRFYEQLGFRVMMDMRNRDENGNPRPANPPQQALYESLGIPKDSHCDGYMMAIPGKREWCRIDLLQWTYADGYVPEKPSQDCRNLGYQRIDLYCENIFAELERLHKVGIDPIYPVCDVDYMGSRMTQCCFRDPDGTLVEFCNVTSDPEMRERSLNRLYREPKLDKEWD